MKEALFYRNAGGKVECFLCPHHCTIADGKWGTCKVRKNVDGKLIAENYGKVSSMHFDPVEKKPLYHYFPGKVIFSIGSVGCNLHCRFCQNWEISQTGVSNNLTLSDYTAEELVNIARSRENNIGIAYTYNEPIVWIEFVKEVAEHAGKAGLKNVMITNGFINPEPLDLLLPYIDAFSVDLKSFSRDFYRQVTSSELEPVKQTLEILHENRKHIEITNLMITDANDDAEEFTGMLEWISSKLGKNTILHISRYFPMYRMTKNPTSVDHLLNFYKIARKHLNYVYLGNLRSKDGQNTFCDKCGTKVIERAGYSVFITDVTADNLCRNCGNPLPFVGIS